MLAPTKTEHKNVAPFADAFDNCHCPTCGTVLVWLPVEGVFYPESSSENDTIPFKWLSDCPTCSVQYELKRIMQRPSDHSTLYGYVQRVDEGDER